MYNFYLASPFFTPEEVKLMKKVLAILENLGFSVFAPFRDAKGVFKTDEETKVGFKKDIEGIDESENVLAITNDYDPGTMWECGYAYAKKIPIIGFSDKYKDTNKFLKKSLVAYIYSFEKLEKFLDLHSGTNYGE